MQENPTKDSIINELAEEFQLTLWSTCSDQKNQKSYVFMDDLGINIIFNTSDQSFELKWMVPKSIFTMECPRCSPYSNKEHFKKIYLKFWRTIYAWNLNMPEKYL